MVEKNESVPPSSGKAMNYSILRHMDQIFWKNKVIQLTLFLTARCNCRCSFCFYLSTKTACQANAPELSIDEIEKISSSLDHLLWLAFSGGEIFLRDDLADIVEIFYKTNQPAIILLPSNGFMPEKIYRTTEATLKRCPKSVVVVKLSLDGPEKLHDSLRGVAGSYHNCMATYKLLAGLLDRFDNFELGINTLFCSANEDKVEETIDFVATLDKVSTHTVSLIRGDVREGELKQVDQQKYHNAIGLLAANLRKKTGTNYSFGGARLKAAQDIVQRRLINKTIIHDQQMIPCQAGRLTLVVTETGDVYPCESFQMKLGNVREMGYDLQQLLKSSKNDKLIRMIKDRACYCTHECYMMMNILFNPLFYPALLKEYIQISR